MQLTEIERDHNPGSSLTRVSCNVLQWRWAVTIKLPQKALICPVKTIAHHVIGADRTRIHYRRPVDLWHYNTTIAE